MSMQGNEWGKHKQKCCTLCCIQIKNDSHIETNKHRTYFRTVFKHRKSNFSLYRACYLIWHSEKVK